MRAPFLLLPLLVSSLSIVTATAQAPPSFATRLEELRGRMEERAFDDADALAESLRVDATQAGDHEAVSIALRMLGAMRVDQERFADARALTIASQEIARAHGLRRRDLEATVLLCRIRALEGDARGAATDVAVAIEALAQIEMPRESLLWAYSQALSVMVGLPGTAPCSHAPTPS